MASYTSKFAARMKGKLAAVAFGVRSSTTQADADVPTITSGAGAASASDPNGSLYLRTDGASTTGLYARISGAWEAIQTAAGLAASTGAGLIGIADANASLVGTTVEAALSELSTPLTLTAAAESSDTIAVTVAGPAQAAQYLATAYDTSMVADAAVFTIAETGAGAEVSTTAKASLLFTTDAAGAATITVTDVAGASSKTFILVVTPIGTSGGLKGGPAAMASSAFDGT